MISVRQSTAIGGVAEQSRSIAEIQAALTVAKSFPRDEIGSLDRIKNSCQRNGLAEKAEYTYSRGGTEITGPTIDLLTCCANGWGNIQFGFRELSQANQESVVEAFAWDLETNSKRTLTFTVPHRRFTKGGSYPLTDPRDIYETVANNAQRRVRSCLEAVIPADVVDAAVAQCRETLKANCDLTPEVIKKVAEGFKKMGVSAEQIEKRIQRRLESMQPAQYLSLRRIWSSINDGMSRVEDWFESAGATPTDEPPKTGVEAAKEALKSKKKAEPTGPSEDVKSWFGLIESCKDEQSLTQLHGDFDDVREGRALADVEAIEAAFASRLEVLTKGAT